MYIVPMQQKKITSSASYIPNEPLHERVHSTDSVLQFNVCVKYKIAKVRFVLTDPLCASFSFVKTETKKMQI